MHTLHPLGLRMKAASISYSLSIVIFAHLFTLSYFQVLSDYTLLRLLVCFEKISWLSFDMGVVLVFMMSFVNCIILLALHLGASCIVVTCSDWLLGMYVCIR